MCKELGVVWKFNISSVKTNPQCHKWLKNKIFNCQKYHFVLCITNPNIWNNNIKDFFGSLQEIPVHFWPQSGSLAHKMFSNWIAVPSMNIFYFDTGFPHAPFFSCTFWRGISNDVQDDCHIDMYLYLPIKNLQKKLWILAQQSNRNKNQPQ